MIARGLKCPLRNAVAVYLQIKKPESNASALMSPMFIYDVSPAVPGLSAPSHFLWIKLYRNTDRSRRGVISFPFQLQVQFGPIAGLNTIFHANLAKDVVHVILHCVLTQMQLGGDATVGFPGGELQEDLLFSPGQ